MANIQPRPKPKIRDESKSKIAITKNAVATNTIHAENGLNLELGSQNIIAKIGVVIAVKAKNIKNPRFS